MLAAQLISAKLNRLSGACSDFCHYDESMNIEVIKNADEFLMKFPIGSIPQDEDRRNALHSRDLLDA